MNDNIKNIELVKKTYEELQDEVIKLITDKFILESNWNSLREYIKNNSIYYNTSDGCQWVDQFKLLDKMNELEGNTNESKIIDYLKSKGE